MTFGPSGRMIWRHRWSYSGLAGVVIVASAGVGSSLSLQSSSQATAADTTGMTGNQAARLVALYEGGQFISGVMATLMTFVALLLVSQSMSFVVDARRIEIAQLRLTGASAGQLLTMIVLESAVIALASSAIGAILGVALLRPYATALTSQGNWPPGVIPSADGGVLLVTVLLMTVVTALGAYLPARRISHTAPIDAVHPVSVTRKLMSPLRWVIAVVGASFTVFTFVIPSQSINWVVVSGLVGIGGVVLVSALSPLIVPPIARLIGSLLTLVAPGASLVARQETVDDPRRTASMATPIVLVLALGALFGIVAQTSRADGLQGYRQIENAHVIVEQALTPANDQRYGQIAALPEVQSTTRIQQVEDWSWSGADSTRDYAPTIYGIDADTIEGFVPLDVTSGSIGQVHGDNIATLNPGDHVGDTLHLQTMSGQEITLHVVAVAKPTSFLSGEFLLDENTFDLSKSSGTDLWFVAPQSGILDIELSDAISQVVPTTDPVSLEDWINQTIDRSVDNQRSAVVTIVSGAAVLAIFSLAQSALTSIRERRSELSLLRRVGASKASVVATIVIEIMLTVITGTVLASLVVLLIYQRTAHTLISQGVQLAPMVPIGLLAIIVVVVVVVGALSAIVGAISAMRHEQPQNGRRTN